MILAPCWTTDCSEGLMISELREKISKARVSVSFFESISEAEASWSMD